MLLAPFLSSPILQAKLGTLDEEFAKWRFAFVSVRTAPKYLEDSDVLGAYYAQTSNTNLMATDGPYLGLQVCGGGKSVGRRDPDSEAFRAMGGRGWHVCVCVFVGG
jgi:hypothetical protein